VAVVLPPGLRGHGAGSAVVSRVSSRGTLSRVASVTVAAVPRRLSASSVTRMASVRGSVSGISSRAHIARLVSPAWCGVPGRRMASGWRGVGARQRVAVMIVLAAAAVAIIG